MANNKSEVQFVDTSKEVKKAMESLAKKALRKGGTVVTKALKDALPARTASLKNHIDKSVYIDQSTGQPTMKIGYLKPSRVKKKGKRVSSSNPHWLEFGTTAHQIKPKNASAMGYNGNFYGKAVSLPTKRGTNILRDTVYNNVDKIREAQAETLKALNETAERALAQGDNTPDDEN